jgi:hypothetical protein
MSSIYIENRCENIQIDVQRVIKYKIAFPSKKFEKYLLHSKHLLDSPRHGVTQALQVILGEVSGPQDLDLPDELGEKPGVLALELLLHVHSSNNALLGLDRGCSQAS